MIIKTTIAQNGLTDIQRCKHSSAKVHDAYMDLSVEFCPDCGSLIFTVATDETMQNWTRYIIDPMTVFENLEISSLYFHEVKSDTESNQETS